MASSSAPSAVLRIWISPALPLPCLAASASLPASRAIAAPDRTRPPERPKNKRRAATGVGIRKNDMTNSSVGWIFQRSPRIRGCSLPIRWSCTPPRSRCGSVGARHACTTLNQARISASISSAFTGTPRLISSQPLARHHGVVLDADADVVELLGHALARAHVDAGLQRQHHAGLQDAARAVHDHLARQRVAALAGLRPPRRAPRSCRSRARPCPASGWCGACRTGSRRASRSRRPRCRPCWRPAGRRPACPAPAPSRRPRAGR